MKLVSYNLIRNFPPLTFDTVVAHGQQEAGGQLRTGSSRRKQRGRGMREIPLGHEIVRFNDRVDVLAVNSHSDTHQHVLGALHHLLLDLQQIRPLQGLEAEVVVAKVTVVDNGRVETLRIVLDDFVVVVGDHGRVLARVLVHHEVQVVHHLAELLLCLLVQVRDGDAGTQNSIVRMHCRHCGGHFCCQVVQLSCRDSRVKAIDNAQRYGHLRESRRSLDELEGNEEKPITMTQATTIQFL